MRYQAHVDQDASIRVAAFEHIRQLEARYGDSISWSAIQEGFEFHGENILLANRARGIFRPRQMSPGRPERQGYGATGRAGTRKHRGREHWPALPHSLEAQEAVWCLMERNLL